ncbi:hypothetical protein PLESTB_001017300 [Pleodorina starrii]|uniref:F-box domain-containing protein n=1 Tax=Pleodorina starrii TaxID=330485 RepID=A0A9W6F4P1_9CHLO|nr:hypothetical protein PLESTM_001190200 [Pleodorina starrii]GLC55710.1 hypothetical protein PLESTB_001017300 [Pleodorina starrii]GLC65458.1 hypothetical protein PLESTF_000295700 [Pleodorina starrii]
MTDHRTNAQKPCWSTLPDGVCEHVASFLPRIATLACRLVCQTWRISFAHSLTQLTLDTRCFGAPAPANAPAAGSNAPPAPLLPAADLPPEWHALTGTIGPALRHVTVRVSLFHESKARAAPCAASCAACLRFLASLPHLHLHHLQLVLPLRYALPAQVTDTLSAHLTRLSSLRLVRCSLTQQAAAALGRLTQLRHLCIAHADLAALPQLLGTEAAARLEHIHVHGYHSLAIMEENPHMRLVWRAAVELVERSTRGSDAWPPPPPQQQQQQQVESPGGDGGTSGAATTQPIIVVVGGGGRLQCLAVSAHHMYHDAVLDESELEFEAEAAQWQIRYDRTVASGGGGGHGDGSGSGGLMPAAVGRRSACGCFSGGCCRDPHEDPGEQDASTATAAAVSGRGTYAGGGSGGWALCAAALVGIRCGCCSGGGNDVSRRSPQRGTSALAAPSPQGLGAGASGILRARGAAAPAAAGDAAWAEPGTPAAGPAPAPPAPPMPGTAGEAPWSAAEAAGLQLLRSAKRSVQLLPLEHLIAEIARPSSRNLQYVQLALEPGPEPPPPPPPTASAAPAQPGDAANKAGCSTGLAGGGGALAVCDRAVGPAGVEVGPVAEAEATPLTHGSLLPSDFAQGDSGVADAALPPVVTLEPLGRLPVLKGLWLDPGQWEEEAERPASGSGDEWDLGHEDPTAGLNVAERRQGQEPPPAAAAAWSAPVGADAARRGDAGGASRRRRRARWGRVGDVWTRLHELPPSRGGGSAAATAHAPVQDLAAHAALLAPVTALRSLALGRRQLSLTRGSVLGLGDDTAELLARLAGLTKLHLAGAYTLPLERGDDSATQLPRNSCPAGGAALWARPPTPRLSPLGSLTALQRLALHFRNPLGRPAVVSHAALPPSLTSLSLYGVVLLPPPPVAAAAAPGSGGSAAATAPRPAPPAFSGSGPADSCAAEGDWRRGGVGGCAAAAAPRPAPPGGQRLERLRELSLTSSYIDGADLLGCGHRLRILSLRDSGLGLAYDSGVVAATGVAPPPQDGRALAGLLRRWHAVQTLRVQGSTATSEDVRLPGAGRCLNWHSVAGLRAITACLPGLRQLHLAPPPPPPLPDRIAHSQPRPEAPASGREAGPATAAAAAAGAAADRADTGTGAASASERIAPGATSPSPQPTSARLHCSDPHRRGDAIGAAAEPLSLPDWRIIRCDRRGAAAAAAAGAAGSGGSASAGGTATGAGRTGATRPDPAGRPPLHADGDRLQGTAAAESGALRAPRGRRSRELESEPETETETEAESDSEADDECEYGSATDDQAETLTDAEPEAGTGAAGSGLAAGAGAGAGGAGGLAPVAGPADRRLAPRRGNGAPRLESQLRLLCRAAPQLQSLRLSATAPDGAAAERAAAAAAALLPRGLPRLDSLSLTLDVGLPYLLAQPQPEAAAREWAGRLRDLERELQSRMRFTCVSVSPHPLLAPRVREAVRALAATRP